MGGTLPKGDATTRKKHLKKVHIFTFGLLITPTGLRIAFHIPHYTKEYCEEHDIAHRTTAEYAADMIHTLPLLKDAEVIVSCDTAYDAKVVRDAYDEKGYIWIFQASCSSLLPRPLQHRRGQESCMNRFVYRPAYATGFVYREIDSAIHKRVCVSQNNHKLLPAIVQRGLAQFSGNLAAQDSESPATGLEKYKLNKNIRSVEED